MSDQVKLEIRWPTKTPNFGEYFSELDRAIDSTYAGLRIQIRNNIATSFKSDKGDVGDYTQLPIYHVADWVLSNWWALLFEPKKSDEAELDHDFRSRHWLGAARNGFALPDLWVVSTEGSVEIDCRANRLSQTRLEFLQTFTELVDTGEVKAAFKEFVEATLAKLDLKGLKTDLHTMWGEIQSTPQDAEAYCRLVGCLGLSPYEAIPEVDEVLDRLSHSLDASALADLCQATTIDTLKKAAEDTEAMWLSLPDKEPIDLSPLVSLDVPVDHSINAWRRGVEAADLVRRSFGIANNAPDGGNIFFKKFDLDVDAQATTNRRNSISATVTAAIGRDDNTIKMALLEDKNAQRRFTAARATFMGWISTPHVGRLVTDARTRDQQASRAFAAELLAPVKFIQSKATNRVISISRMNEIANELHVSPMVVQYQAKNNRLEIAQA